MGLKAAEFLKGFDVVADGYAGFDDVGVFEEGGDFFGYAGVVYTDEVYFAGYGQLKEGDGKDLPFFKGGSCFGVEAYYGVFFNLFYCFGECCGVCYDVYFSCKGFERQEVKFFRSNVWRYAVWPCAIVVFLGRSH